MITLGTVSGLNGDPYLKNLCEWAVNRTELVSEVIIISVASKIEMEEEWKIGNIKFKKYGCGIERASPSYFHGHGLKKLVEKATNDLILTCDVDMFFYKPVDVFYYELMEKYDLDIIGISHYSATTTSQGFFPNVMNFLVRKSNLPDEDFCERFGHGPNAVDAANRPSPQLIGEYFLSHYFVAGENSPVVRSKFANPSGIYDTGSLLYLWAVENNWKWHAFQTLDTHRYSGAYNRGTQKIKEKFKPKDYFLYHTVSGTICTKDEKDVTQTARYKEYVQEYNESKGS